MPDTLDLPDYSAGSIPSPFCLISLWREVIAHLPMCQSMHNGLEMHFHQKKLKAPRFSETAQTGVHRLDCQFPVAAFGVALRS